MHLYLYNTMSRQKEAFAPLDGDNVKMYVCGITPYDTGHMGHAMTYLTFDVLNRYCQDLGWRVTYVQNVTDIDDDIIRKGKEVDEPWDRLGDRYIREFQQDLNGINLLWPDFYARATREMDSIIDMVKSLVDQGKAYERDGNVYFRTASDPEYGRLCGCSTEEMIALSAERGADPNDPRKEQPLDFILWQAMQPGEPHWSSPWGEGRPGWHIECSAMALRFLGPSIDIHGGGGDLVYPHHESEIAQTEGYTHHSPSVRFWMHVGMVGYQGEKMSKSLGNLVLVRNVLREQTPDALKLYLLNHHYREAWEYMDDGPAEWEQPAALLREAARLVSDGEGASLDLTSAMEEFRAAIEDDLSTPTAINTLLSMGREIVAAARAGRDVSGAQTTFKRAAGILGLPGTR